jgi:two-component system sensor histidine kinase CiaH
MVQESICFILHRFLTMISVYKRKRLAFITIIYWFLLVYVVAALVWWFIALEKQNADMFDYRVSLLQKESVNYNSEYQKLSKEKQRKTSQYIGEGSTFLLVILVGALFVYRATGKQLKLSKQQQNFMMAVTHELKTPIAVIYLNLETLQKRKLD